ncbi:vacuolar protein-sorting-associated protein [Pestalotiopsis sp. NC0098]|nr:vacuolar protein-sorting-associated protein [Pestalotiopsis sp. NC0098]
MKSVKTFFFGPDLAEQNARIQREIRKNEREITKAQNETKRSEIKAKNLIIAADKRAQRSPALARQANEEARMFASELARKRKQQNRLAEQMANIKSVKQQVDLAFGMQKIQGTLGLSVKVMQDVNQIIRIPELHNNAQALAKELMTAGIIDEMTDEMLPAADELEVLDDETEGVLNEVLKSRMEKAGTLPVEPIPVVPVTQEPAPVEEEDVADDELRMDFMRDRLEALKS